MKNQKLSKVTLAGILLLSTAINPQYINAQTLAETEQTTQEQAVTQAKLRVVRISDTALDVKIDNLSSSGVESGMGQMILRAELQPKELENGSPATSLVFTQAALKDDENPNQEKTTYISNPFSTELFIEKDKIKTNDDFDMQLDGIELIAIWERLNREIEALAEELEEEVEEEVSKLNNNDGSSTTKATESDSLFETPEFDVANDEPVYTTEECGINIDLEQQVAILQEQTLTDGEVTGTCSDTITRYPLEKKYSSCPISFNPEEMVGYEQYTLSYTRDDVGTIQVEDCQPDEDRIVQLEENIGNCGIRSDYDAGISYQQTQITYQHNGITQTYQSCQDSDITYEQTVTQNGCDPIEDINNNLVTFQERIYITVDGIEQTVRSCQPNAETTTNIISEDCASPRYTHDYQTGQSYLNKNYYYLDTNGNRQDILSCAASTETFEHLIDIGACTPSHDDVAKETTYRGRTYIQDGDNQVYLSSCEDQLPAIPYVNTGSVWNVHSSNNSTLNLAASDQNNIGINGRYMYQSPYFTKTYSSSAGDFYYLNTRDDQTWAWAQQGRSSRYINVVSPKYCIANVISGDWDVGGVNINETMSNQTPQWSWQQTTDNIERQCYNSGCTTKNGYAVYQSAGGTATLTYSCTQPTCLHTELRANPTYTRADGSLFPDTSITTDVMHVCGDGSNLEGQSAD